MSEHEKVMWITLAVTGPLFFAIGVKVGQIAEFMRIRKRDGNG